MCLLFSLFPATMFTILGYIVLYCSTKADGTVKIFGKVLSICVFILAAMPLIMGAYVTLAGICPLGPMMEKIPR